ncbi:MAG: ferrous iron transport protein B [Tannerellaceae bacterium]|jgi:ferrous iron transport protein B|nr:ferrous iron transport protein B [Tannerellaceae bacterium]
MRLSELQTGEKGVIVKVTGRGGFRKRIIEMGFVKGKEVEVIRNAPLKDPVHYRVMGYDVSLRRSEAALIEVIGAAEFEGGQAGAGTGRRDLDCRVAACGQTDVRSLAIERGKTIHVALVGNPNSGKTTFFNHASGAHEHVGNYSGVTVDAKDATFKQDGYTFKIVDLPGTYSLSPYSPEERFVRKHLNEACPDVVINVVDASNLERNLYLTTQLIDMDARMVIALNMYDSLQKRGDVFDYRSLERMIGAPIVPVVSKTGFGIRELFGRVIQVYEEEDPVVRHIHINYGDDLEKAITRLRTVMKESCNLPGNLSGRYLAMKLLEGDTEIDAFMGKIPGCEAVRKACRESVTQVETLLQEDSETAFTNARYGFIAGALRETLELGKAESMKTTQLIDLFVTNRALGFPVFILFMWITFAATFSLGAYPMQWIESGVAWTGSALQQSMQQGPLKDLLIDGIIGGVGGVVVFLPNILILYFFISFMEDSGYMARAAFIMDKIMHKMGLHGKSFIPLIMGFGCSVPAIMASRTIESRNSRLITMLINPLMSCSARLPVYILLAGAFFPHRQSVVLLALYLSGILLAAGMARLFKRFLFNEEDVPFVMELPPYRTPALQSILIHMWEKAKQYLKKMGGIILLASIIIWFLGYFPLPPQTDTGDEQARKTARQQNSCIGRLGQTIQPLLHPLGFDWKISVSLLSGMAAKEVVVSTLGVLYTVDEGAEETQKLGMRMKQDLYPDGSPVFTPLVALSLMVFVLIYFPCIATITAISKEAGSWKWGLFTIVYTCILAWMAAFIVYQGGALVYRIAG